MTTAQLVIGVGCLCVSSFFAGAATWHWWLTRPLRAERRRQERDAHDARAFGVTSEEFRG